MKYKKFFFSIIVISFIAINLNISSGNSTSTSSVRLSQIAFASDTEGGGGAEDNNFKKCGQGTVSFTPAHGATACRYCGDCIAHWVFLSNEGDCKLF